MWKEVAVA